VAADAAVVVARAAAVVVEAVAAEVEAAAAAAIEVAAVAEPLQADFHPIALAVGEAWANEIVRTLRSDDREIIGAWPGTLREARMRMRLALRSKVELDVLEELARVAYVAARRGWQEVSEQDPES
jgi:hypothetical protein